MQKILEKLFIFFLRADIKNLRLVQVFKTDFTFEYYFYINYKKNIYEENIYIYIRAKKILEILLTFIMFLILYKFDIKILSEDFIIYYKYYISIVIFFLIFFLLKNLFIGYFNKNLEI